MIHSDLLKEKQLIDNLFGDIKAFQGDPYLQSLLTNYLCVRVSGFLENCVRIIFTNYSAPRSKDNIINFVGKKLERFPNPTYDNILSLAADFNTQWKNEFKKQVKSPPQLLSSLNSINVNRNLIAHGGTSSLTIGELEQYYKDTVNLISILERCCK